MFLAFFLHVVAAFFKLWRTDINNLNDKVIKFEKDCIYDVVNIDI